MDPKIHKVVKSRDFAFIENCNEIANVLITYKINVPVKES